MVEPRPQHPAPRTTKHGLPIVEYVKPAPPVKCPHCGAVKVKSFGKRGIQRHHKCDGCEGEFVSFERPTQK